jgi:hypothetical protein
MMPVGVGVGVGVGLDVVSGPFSSTGSWNIRKEDGGCKVVRMEEFHVQRVTFDSSVSSASSCSS